MGTLSIANISHAILLHHSIEIQTTAKFLAINRFYFKLIKFYLINNFISHPNLQVALFMFSSSMHALVSMVALISLIIAL